VPCLEVAVVEISDDLKALNLEIGKREEEGDRDWFEKLLGPVFAMRRAGGALVDRAEFLQAVERSHVRVTEDIVVEQAEVTAVAKCVVSMPQPDGTWERYRNTRLFTRAETGSKWQLIGWANEPVGSA
jgi:hypothetical protein